jgi:uncharacterized membrane protein (DUF485 family)
MDTTTRSRSATAQRPASPGERWRLWLFLFYLAFYLGFMLLTTFRLDLMASEPFGGVNLAVLYGLALIVAALALALLYMWLCRDRPLAAPAGAGRVRTERTAAEDAGL